MVLVFRSWSVKSLTLQCLLKVNSRFTSWLNIVVRDRSFIKSRNISAFFNQDLLLKRGISDFVRARHRDHILPFILHSFSMDSHSPNKNHFDIWHTLSVFQTCLNDLFFVVCFVCRNSTSVWLSWFENQFSHLNKN